MTHEHFHAVPQRVDQVVCLFAFRDFPVQPAYVTEPSEMLRGEVPQDNDGRVYRMRLNPVISSS